MPHTFLPSAALPRRSPTSVIKKLTVLVILLTAAGSLVSAQITNFDVVRGELTFTEVPGAAFYRVEWSKTLEAASWDREAPGVPRIEPLGAGPRTVKIDISQPPCFYRVVAEMAPPEPEGFVLIPAGTFQMGDALLSGDPDERPVHRVNVSAFFLQARETTKSEWDEVLTWALANGYTFDNLGRGKAPDHPVIYVSWYDVVKWCNARSQKEGLVPCYYADAARTLVYKRGRTELTNERVLWSASGYRLPTEAEWEKAARGGFQGRRYPWGDSITHSQANYFSDAEFNYDVSPTRTYHPSFETGTQPFTSPVGSFAPNGYGLYDVTGNVWEWCWDWYDSGFYNKSPALNPRGPSFGSLRVGRGGSWNRHAAFNTLADRAWRPSVEPRDHLGFRPVRSL
jgi:formylglycine-generating enzyme required for sulfatase activity